MGVTWSDNKNIVKMTAQNDVVTIRNPIKFVHVFEAVSTAGDVFDLTEVTSGLSVARAVADQDYFDKIVPVADGKVGPLVLTTLSQGVEIYIHLKKHPG